MITYPFPGRLVARHRLPKNAVGDPWRWQDLNVGMDIGIYGRVFHIYDCDGWTRVRSMTIHRPSVLLNVSRVYTHETLLLHPISAWWSTVKSLMVSSYPFNITSQRITISDNVMSSEAIVDWWHPVQMCRMTKALKYMQTNHHYLFLYVWPFECMSSGPSRIVHITIEPVQEN